jgi:hypothetical protein
MKLTQQEVKARLESAQSAGSVAAVVCISAPLIYFILLYLFRLQVADVARTIANHTFGYRITVWFLVFLLVAPIILLPKLYAVLSDIVSSSSSLACPECGHLIASGRDWKICLFTKKCPHCRECIITETEPQRNTEHTGGR